MADRCSASIIIGGTLSAALLPEFIALIISEDLSVDYDGPAFMPEDIVSGEPLMLCAYEVSWGTFSQLEPFCRVHKLPYSRWNGACNGAWGCGRSVYRGADHIGAEAEEYDVSEDDHILMGHGLICKLGTYEAILAHFAFADFDVPPLVIGASV